MDQENKVAKQIMEQLGGAQFIIMTGISTFIADETSLKMKLPRNHSTFRWLKITLDPSKDLYKMDFHKLTPKFDIVGITIENVYADKLQYHFTDVTGFDTTLKTT